MKKTLIRCSMIMMLAGCQNMFESKTVEIPIDPDEMLVVNEEDFSDYDVTPDVYAIAAARATNKMLDETESLYSAKDQKPKLYIAPIKKLKEKLPDGFYFARKTTEDIIEGSRNYVVVENLEEADYKLETEVDAVPNPEMRSPVIDYTLRLVSVQENGNVDNKVAEKDETKEEIKEEKTDENADDESTSTENASDENKTDENTSDEENSDKENPDENSEDEKTSEDDKNIIGSWTSTMKQLQNDDKSWW